MGKRITVSENTLAEHRIKKGWSQATLAGKTNVSETYIKLLEKDERCPSLPQAYVFEVVLGVPVQELWPVLSMLRRAS